MMLIAGARTSTGSLKERLVPLSRRANLLDAGEICIVVIHGGLQQSACTAHFGEGLRRVNIFLRSIEQWRWDFGHCANCHFNRYMIKWWSIQSGVVAPEGIWTLLSGQVDAG